MTGRLPLRVRVAAAFLAAATLAVAVLGFFVQLRVTDTLEGRTHDLLEAELDGLAALPANDRARSIASLTGDVHAQALRLDGTPIASSPLVAGPLVTATQARSATENGEASATRTVTLYDDDAIAAGRHETETERTDLLFERYGDQVLVVGTSREDTDDALASVRQQLLIGGPLALLVAGVLGYLVAGAALRPIERMRDRAATISDRSSGERLPVPSAHDELRRLAVTLNAMLDRLDEGLARQRAFVAEASHELRTPLALLRTEVDLALHGERSPEELRAALASVRDDAGRLTALAEDLLTLASADEGRLLRERAPVDLTTLAGDVVSRFASAASPRSVRLGAAGAVVVPADGERLERVLANLVDNALRHGEGDVVVAVSEAGAEAVVDVSDAGPGFGVDDPFGRFTGSRVSSGLGLAIVDEIVRAHGGTVEVDEVPSRTTVRVRLPR